MDADGRNESNDDDNPVTLLALATVLGLFLLALLLFAALCVVAAAWVWLV